MAQDHTDSKMKRDPAATEQQSRDAGGKSETTTPERRAAETKPASETAASKNAANKDETGSRDDAKRQTENRNTTSKPADTAASKSSSGKAAESKGDKDRSKRADDRDHKPAGAAADNKSGTASPKSAEKASDRSPSAEKSAQKSEPDRKAQSKDSARDAAQNKSGSEPKEHVAAKLDPQKKSRLTAAIDKVNVKPIKHVDFSVSVGVAVPRTVELRPVPTTIVEIVPQYRGYDFFVVRDEVVIVEPRSHKIVDVIERRPSHARAETTTRHVTLSKHQREIIHRHATSRRTVTTGAAARTTTEVTVGETLPESVEVESFPEEVYREVPAVREYRYIERGDDVYLVDPSSRRVIEEVR